MSGGAGLAAWQETWRARVDAALDEVLPRADDAPAVLHGAMRYAVFGGGKRLRPLCVLLAAQAAGAAEERALPAACALELIHTYSLVHDDLPAMDDDDLRRGRPTVHKVHGDAIAILAGDALLTLAFEVAGRGLDGDAAARVTSVLARAAGSRGMVGGQADDLAAEGRDLSVDEVLSIDRRKTGALFAAAFRIGAICAAADAATETTLATIGTELGTAFQIIDDLLDLRGSAASLGKAAGKDRARGKATMPAAAGESAAFAEAQRRSQIARSLAIGLEFPRLIEELATSMLNRSH